MPIIKITEPIFKSRIILCYRIDKKSLHKLLDKHNYNYPNESEGIISAVFQLDNAGEVAMWLSDDVSYEFALHETLHACFIIFRRKGLSLVPESEEAYTYYISHMFKMVWEKIREIDEKFEKSKSAIRKPRTKGVNSVGESYKDKRKRNDR